MTASKRNIVIAAIFGLTGVIISINLPRCTPWLAEHAICTTLTRQTALLQQGGSISVSSAQLESLWHDDMRYLIIIPAGGTAVSQAKFPSTISRLASKHALLGVCLANDRAADSLFQQNNIRFFHQTGFGLTALRPDQRIGIYAIRRAEIEHPEQQTDYILTLEEEF